MSLVASTALYPDDLLQCPPALGDRRWWVLYTKSRQEKVLAERLLAQCIPFYLPLIEKHSVCRGRKHSARLPVFANYVFLFGSPEERLRSLESNRISRVLEVEDQQVLARDLLRLNQLIQSRAPLTVESRLQPGQRVRVRNGPLAGMEGTVLLRQNKTRLLVSVDFLQQGASVEIEDFRLEPI